MSANNVDINTLLSDLGRPTRRGVRKCPQCGTINGTRGISCKNGICTHVFKELPPERRRLHLDACKLITDYPGADIFSVKNRERGINEQRGFIRLEPKDAFDEISPDAAHLARTSARATCYVEGCSKYSVSIPISITGQGAWDNFPKNDETPCIHVTGCLHTGKEAQPFPVKHSILNSISISGEWKQKIWLKARSDGPLVQRVSASAMVVKCDVESDLHPLGYLHTYFVGGGSLSPSATSKSGSSDLSRFACTCQSIKAATGPPTAKSSPRKRSSVFFGPLHPSNSTDAGVRCIHFYSCIAVFSGDVRLSKEFARFIIDDKVMSSMQQVMALLGQDEEGRPVRVEVLDETPLDENFQVEENSEVSQMVGVDSRGFLDELEFQIEMEGSDGTIRTISLPSKSISVAPGDDQLQLDESDDFLGGSDAKRNRGFVDITQGQLTKDSSSNVTSLEWLASVSERINQTMHYQFTGNPEALVFSVPQSHFDFLRERLSLGKTKKRLPNSTITFVKSDAPPIGTFTKYIWSFINIFQVKSIFDNPYVQLDVSRRFVLNKDSTFSFVPEPNNSNQTFALSQKSKHLDEFKTFLKVGQTTPDSSDITPFTIEWIPDILPRTKVGEMRILFKFGHLKNGQLDTTRV